MTAVTARALRLTRPEPTEAMVLRAVRRYLELHPKCGWVARMNTGRFVVGEGDQRRIFNAGFAGLSDLLGQAIDGRIIACEVKRPSGRVSPDQQAFLERVRRNGGISFVARDIRDAERAMREAFPCP